MRCRAIGTGAALGRIRRVITAACVLIFAAALPAQSGSGGNGTGAAAASGSATAAGGDPGDATPFEEFLPEGTFTVAFRAFEAADVVSSHRYLSQNLPRLIAQELEPIGSHRLSEAEQSAYLRLFRDRRTARAGAELDSLRQRQSDILFSTDPPTERSEARRNIAEDIAEARQALAEARNARLSFPESVPVAFRESTELLSATGSALRLAREADAELVIGGELESLENYVHLSVYVYHRVLERRIVETETTALAEELSSRIDGIVRELSTAILGRPWASLTVNAQPDRGVIYVDDRLAGVGTASLRFLSPGEHRVRVTLSEGPSAERTVTLDPEEAGEIDVEVPVPGSDTVRLQSEPAGADVYDGALWRGVTPLTVERPLQQRSLFLELEGYDRARIVLRPDGPVERTVELYRDVRDEVAYVEERRNRFYRAFGYFALSVPIPVILYGAYENRAAVVTGGLFEQLNPQEQTRLARTGNILYWSSMGAATVSATLLTNMVIKLVQYVRASEHAHIR